MADATCYESLPSSSHQWKTSMGIHRVDIWPDSGAVGGVEDTPSRSKYDEIRKRYMNYSRNRKKTQKKKRKLLTPLIYLLDKLDCQLDAIEKQYRGKLQLDGIHHKRRNIIGEVLSQQK